MYSNILCTFPNVFVRGSSGLMQALSFLCSGFRIQSSQYLYKNIIKILCWQIYTAYKISSESIHFVMPEGQYKSLN